MAKIGLYGGGFKPPTRGHFEVVKQALESNPDLDSLIVIVGQKERGGIDQADSLVIWDMYLKYLPLKVEILPVATPIRTVYNLAKENPQDEYKWFLGKRQGREDDESDIVLRTKHLTTKKDDYPNLTPITIKTADGGVSGTKAREYIENNDKTGFFSLLPNNLSLEEKEQIYTMVSKKINEGGHKKKDPKTGTGKKPEGSGRRLYTDEDPTDTVKIKFRTKEDIVDTLNKKSFKAKSHARQSQIINLIHQRVRAAYQNSKDPDTKSRLKRALDYITNRKEKSKEKTKRLRQQNEGKKGFARGNVGARYRAIEKRGSKYYYRQDDPLGAGIKQEFGPFDTKAQAIKKMEEFPPATSYRDITDNIDPKAQKKHKGKAAPYGSGYEPLNEIGIELSNYSGQILPGDVVYAPKGFPLRGNKKLIRGLALKVIKNTREGVNRYKLTLEDPKTGEKYSVRNFEMDGEYKGEKLPQWSLVRKSTKNIEELVRKVGDYYHVMKRVRLKGKTSKGKAGKGKRRFKRNPSGEYKYKTIKKYKRKKDATDLQRAIDINYFGESLQMTSEGDTYEKMAAKGKKTGTLKQGTVRKRLGIKKGEKVPLSLIKKEIARLKKMDKDPKKKGAQLGDKNQKYYKALQLAKTLKTTTNINENATYSDSIDYRQQILNLTKHMLEKGENITPLPNVVFKHGDQENAKEFLGKTAYYDPNTMTIVLYTEGRHPKDIVRSFSHEMIHHQQNLKGKLNNINTTNTLENDYLEDIEKEAYLEGNINFRNYTDSQLHEEKPYKHKFGFNKKLGRDPFGISAFAYELARGLEEQEDKIETKYTIYSDMDGVLTDFDSRFKEFSKGIAPKDYENKFGIKKFWNLVDEIGGVDFWADMDWMSDGKTYWNYISKYDPIILTAPSMNPVSRLGKRKWRDSNLPGVRMKMASARNKPNYSKRNSILIDDRQDTIDAWNAGGGIGIHHTSAANTIKRLKELGL